MRLNKFLAHSLGLSRREADNVISAGRVKVNGIPAILGVPVGNNDSVTFDGRPVGQQTAYTYIALNKPVGYLCSRRSQGGVPTIYSLLPPKYRALKPVGRLDKDSSGILLLTDDGDFAHRMTHPSFHKVKIYEVTLDKPLQPLHQQMISDIGVSLEDGVSRFLVTKTDSADSRQPTADRKSQEKTTGPDPQLSALSSQLSTSYTVTMHEGRNRQIRRTFAALGYTVTRLHRTTFGNYSLGDIKNGEHTLVDIS